MRYKKLKLSAFLLLGLRICGLHAQEALPAAGGNASGSGGSVSFSIGQVFYNTDKDGNSSVTQGVQQPYEITVTTGLEDIKWINLDCSVYPNPTTNYLTLKVDASTKVSIQSLSYQLHDMNGKLIRFEKVENLETQIDMTNLVSESYLLEVINRKKIVKSFKIIKR